ncbi:MAG: LuxR C-terminal-related transcriptional regulator [Bacteroidales bacterium]|nr:LuxR C-terminal-related transcriptional regulator [Bacteroidales bacterium]
MKGLVYLLFILFFPVQSLGYLYASTIDKQSDIPVQQSSDSTSLEGLNKLFEDYELQKGIKRFESAREALNLSQKSNSIEHTQQALIILADEYQKLGQAVKSEMLYREALRIDSLVLDTINQIKCLIGLGISFREQDKMDESYDVFRFALAQAEQSTNMKMTCLALANLGVNYIEKDEYDLSLDYLLRALDISKKYKKETDQAYIHLLLGRLGVARKDVQYAIGEFYESLEIAESSKDESSICGALLELGNCYITISEMKKAEEYLDSAGQIAMNQQSWGIALKTFEQLASIKYHQKLFGESLDYLKLSSLLKDSIFNQNKSNMLADMQALFHIAEKENEIEARKQEIMLFNREKRINKIQTIGLSILIVLLLIVAFLLFLRQREKIQKNKIIFEKQKEIYSARQAMLEAELKNNEIEKSKLQNELLFKQNEIVNYALSVIQKNEYFGEIKQQVSELLKLKGIDRNHEITAIIRRLVQTINANKDIDDVQKNIEEVNYQFMYQLKENFPNLSDNEKRLCGFLRIGLSNKEIAALNNISLKAVEMARYRLRKKLDIDGQVDLAEFFETL